MEGETTDRLAQLNGYQVAILALAASAVAALGVLFLLRRSGIVSSHPSPGEATETSVATGTAEDETVNHFSEELLVPGFTFTGEDVSRQDTEQGRSPEGV